MINIAVILGLLIFGGVAGGGGLWYLQHDEQEKAIATCNANWKVKIDEADLKLARASEEKTTALRAAEATAEQNQRDADAKLASTQQALDLARQQTPLSEPCAQCTVPIARIKRVRSDSPRGANSHGTPRIIRHRSHLTPSGQPNAVPGIDENGTVRPGTGKGP